MKTRELRRRLMRVGINYEDANVVARRIGYQIAHMGLENTAKYLKAVGDRLLFHLYETGTPEVHPWVATVHGFPKFIKELSGYPECVLLRVAKMARVIRLQAVTNTQLKKVIQGAISPFNGSEAAVREMSRLMSLGVSRLGLVPKDSPSSDQLLIGRQFTKVMSVSGPVPNTHVPPLLESMHVLKAWPELTSLPGWESAFLPLLPHCVKQVWERVDAGPRVAGQIHATQEGGAKLRMFASPYTAIQCVMAPVHDWFASYLETLPMNCTWDQLLGAENAQARLRDGYVVYSLDLSTATCRFPLSVQKDMARELGLSDVWLQAIEAISRGEWAVSRDLQEKGAPSSLRWAVGQPLGMRFSMSMFSLTHNLVLAGISAQVGANPWKAFNVLGDDVVIYDSRVATVYSQLVQACGVPISWNKSHASDRVAEFAGATITPDLVLRPGQFREASIGNVLSLAETFGVLRHETSKLSQKVQKLHLFRNGQVVWESLQEYQQLLRANSSSIADAHDIPVWASKAPKWFLQISKVYKDQFRDTGVTLHFDMRLNRSVKSIWRKLPKTVNMDFSKSMYEMNPFVDPFRSALYWAWFGLWKDYSEVGLYSPDQFTELVEDLLDDLRSLQYLPPRSKTEATQFKRLLSACLPHKELAREMTA